MYGSLVLHPIIGVRLASRPWPWCARILEKDERWGFKREFITPIYDYTLAAKSGRGLRLYYSLPPGYYEVYTPISWKHEERYFIRVDEAGTINRISKEEITEEIKMISRNTEIFVKQSGWELDTKQQTAWEMVFVNGINHKFNVGGIPLGDYTSGNARPVQFSPGDKIKLWDMRTVSNDSGELVGFAEPGKYVCLLIATDNLSAVCGRVAYKYFSHNDVKTQAINATCDKAIALLANGDNAAAKDILQKSRLFMTVYNDYRVPFSLSRDIAIEIDL